MSQQDFIKIDVLILQNSTNCYYIGHLAYELHTSTAAVSTCAGIR